MNNVLDRLAIRLADVLGLDRCVMVCRLRWLLCWRPEVRSVWREMLSRVQRAPVLAEGRARGVAGTCAASARDRGATGPRTA